MSSSMPNFTGPIEGFVVNFISKHYWKVARTVPREDLMQDAYVVFLRCSNKYGGKVEPKHFMALFKTAWLNHFTDLTNADTEERCVYSSTPEDGSVEMERVGELCNDGELAVRLRQAPKEVQMVLQLFLNAPQELLDIALNSWRGNDKRMRNGGSGKINQLLGLPADCNIQQMMEDYFTKD